MSDHDQPGARRLRLELTPGQLPPLPAARRWIAETFARAGGLFVADGQLVATELITNAYDHGGGATGIRLAYDPDARQLVVEVDDASARRPQRREAHVRDVRGRGLLLVNAVTRVWGTRPAPSGGKTVWAVLQLPESPVPAAAPQRKAGHSGQERPASDIS